ncbi:MAG: acetolactate synthase large subunit [Sciscionella sp.]
MNGAQALIRTLVDSGVDVCFANPGTSEMHFVAALDSVTDMRAVLCLFEGVATGAADGYARMAGKPAATLLHLGPGLGNGFANLHNAKRAFTPVVNVVGEHATYHQRYDAPLASDIPAIAEPVSKWVRTSAATEDVGADAADAVAAATAYPGGVATLIVPADVSWSDGGQPGSAPPAGARSAVPADTVAAVAKALRTGEPATVLLGSGATDETALLAASRIAEATGAKVLVETFPARLERGAGLPEFDRLGYLAEQAIYQLTNTRHMILVGARSPVSFFAYPDKPSDVVPDGCEVHVLAENSQDGAGALRRLADEVAAGVEPRRGEPHRPEPPTGELNVQNFAEVIGAELPEAAIVVDEANTSGFLLPTHTAGAPRHDWLTLTGGAIGQGLPLAAGAAIACPDRPVICLEADGSAMYTLSALWTYAREGLDVTTVVINNNAYAILRMELQRVGATSLDARSADLLDLSRPNLDFVSLATGMGVPASRARTAEELAEQLRRAVLEPGPHLIDAIVPSMI